MRTRVQGMLPAVVLCAACVSVHVVNTWRDPQYAGPPLRRVLACGLHPDEATRRTFEDFTVKELRARGVEATPCYQALPQGRPAPEQLQQAVRDSGAEGAIVTRYAGAREELHFDPGYIGVGPAFYWGPFYTAYGPMWDYVYGPGYASSDVEVRLVTNVYRVDDAGRLLWTGTSDTLNPQSAGQLIGAALPKILGRVEQAGLLPRKP